jgi:hypothetical protein
VRVLPTTEQSLAKAIQCLAAQRAAGERVANALVMPIFALSLAQWQVRRPSCVMTPSLASHIGVRASMNLPEQCAILPCPAKYLPSLRKSTKRLSSIEQASAMLGSYEY